MKQLLVGSVVTLLSASVASGAIVFCEGFESYTPGTEPTDPPWGEHRPHPDTTADVAQEDSNKYLHIVDDQTYVGGSANLGHKLDSPITDSYRLQFDVRINDLDLHNASIWLYGDAGSDALVHYSNGAHGGEKGYFHIYGPPPGSGYDWFHDKLDLQVEADKWYTISRTLDMTTNDGWFEIWERGKKDSTRKSVPFGAWKPNTYIDTLRIETDGSLQANTDYDNICLLQNGDTWVIDTPFGYRYDQCIVTFTPYVGILKWVETIYPDGTIVSGIAFEVNGIIYWLNLDPRYYSIFYGRIDRGAGIMNGFCVSWAGFTLWNGAQP